MKGLEDEACDGGDGEGFEHRREGEGEEDEGGDGQVGGGDVELDGLCDGVGGGQLPLLAWRMRSASAHPQRLAERAEQLVGRL